ncbi:MAG: hypothetical protein CK522_01935 [Opitutia bacterium]|nr:MAG: hypothetical protein CK522_01935 [Opitutae bacterium]
MNRSGLIVGIATVFTVAVIAWFWTPTPIAKSVPIVAKPTAPGAKPRPILAAAPRSAAGLKLDPARNVFPDSFPPAERQKFAWARVVREVQEMNEVDRERFAAALRSWVEVPANKEVLERIQQINKDFPTLAPESQEARLPLAESLYEEGMRTLRLKYAETPTGLTLAK